MGPRGFPFSVSDHLLQVVVDPPVAFPREEHPDAFLGQRDPTLHSKNPSKHSLYLTEQHYSVTSHRGGFHHSLFLQKYMFRHFFVHWETKDLFIYLFQKKHLKLLTTSFLVKYNFLQFNFSVLYIFRGK